METRRVSLGNVPQRIEFGLPLAAVVFAAIAVLTLIVGAFSPAVGFAFFVLGLLAAVLVDFSALRQKTASRASAARPRRRTSSTPARPTSSRAASRPSIPRPPADGAGGAPQSASSSEPRLACHTRCSSSSAVRVAEAWTLSSIPGIRARSTPSVISSAASWALPTTADSRLR
jgi:hypothetical protein